MTYKNNKFVTYLFYAVFLFVLVISAVFYPIFLQNKKYGLSHIEQSVFLHHESYQEFRHDMPNYSIYSINNNLDFNADYINLHLPKIQKQNQAYSKSEIPVYDESRILGLSLLGHPLTDVFNPLNLFFKNFDSEDTIIFKDIAYLLLGLIFYIRLIFKLHITNNPALIVSGAFLYVLMPNSIYYLHWDNYVGLTMLLPLIFIGIIDLANKNWSIALLYLTAAGVCSFLFNMFELFCYSIIFTSIFFIAFVVREIESKKQFGQIIGLIFVTALLIILIAFPQIYYSLDYLSELKRTGSFNWEVYAGRQAYFPKHDSQFLGLLGFPVIWKTQHNIFANLGIILAIIITITNYRVLSNVMKAIVVTFLASIVFLFIGFIDLPLQLFDFYNLFANQIRSIYILIFLGSILFIYGCDILLFQKSKIVWKWLGSNVDKVLILIIAFQLFVIICFYLGLNFFNISSRLAVYRDLLNHFYYLGALICAPVFSLILFYKFYGRFIVLLPVTIIIPLLVFAKMIVPFYDQKDVLYLERYNNNSFATRAILIDQNNEQKCPNCWQRDLGSILWSMGEVPITGYDTGVTRKTTEIFREFWRESDYETLAVNPKFSWIHWQDYWIPPTPNQLVGRDDHRDVLRHNISKKLQLLGVSRIYTNYALDNLVFKGAFYNYNLYDLGLKTPFGVVTGCNLDEIELVILASQYFEESSCEIANLSKNSVELVDSLPKFDISSPAGFLVLPYDLPSNFYLEDVKTNAKIDKNQSVGFYIVDLTKHSSFMLKRDDEVLNGKLKISFIGLLLLIIMSYLLRKY